MLAKLGATNQITLPEEVMQAIGPVEYFEVTLQDGQIVLTPVTVQTDAVREKLAELSISQQDIADAVAWARQHPIET
ncbi:MAG: AbrB/MazE/SpoVT family DNA-binding domain-containing protein [Cyanobacteria bacterium P01_C01_bin.120]